MGPHGAKHYGPRVPYATEQNLHSNEPIFLYYYYWCYYFFYNYFLLVFFFLLFLIELLLFFVICFICITIVLTLFILCSFLFVLLLWTEGKFREKKPTWAKGLPGRLLFIISLSFRISRV